MISIDRKNQERKQDDDKLSYAAVAGLRFSCVRYMLMG
jgi:hypothetical protein